MARVDFSESMGSVLALTFCSARAALLESSCNSSERWISGLAILLSVMAGYKAFTEVVFNRELNQFISEASAAWRCASEDMDVD